MTRNGEAHAVRSHAVRWRVETAQTEPDVLSEAVYKCKQGARADYRRAIIPVKDTSAGNQSLAITVHGETKTRLKVRLNARLRARLTTEDRFRRTRSAQEYLAPPRPSCDRCTLLRLGLGSCTNLLSTAAFFHFFKNEFRSPKIRK